MVPATGAPPTRATANIHAPRLQLPTGTSGNGWAAAPTTAIQISGPEALGADPTSTPTADGITGTPLGEKTLPSTIS